MNKSLLTILLGSLLSLGLATAYANHHQGGEHEKMEMEADANKDGKVSYDEFKAAREKHMEEHFKKRDTNADGFIDEAERKAAKEQWKGKGKDRCEKH